MLRRSKIMFLVLVLLISMLPAPSRSSTKVTGQLPTPLKFEIPGQIGGVPVKAALMDAQVQSANLPAGTFKPGEYVAVIQGGMIKNQLQADQNGAAALPTTMGKFYIVRGDSPIQALTPRKLPLAMGWNNYAVISSNGKLYTYKPYGYNMAVTEFDLATQQEKVLLSTMANDSWRRGRLTVDGQGNLCFLWADSSSGWGSYIAKYQNGSFTTLLSSTILAGGRGIATIGSKIFVNNTDYTPVGLYTVDGTTLRQVSTNPGSALAPGPKGTIISYPVRITLWDGTTWIDLGCPLSRDYNWSLTPLTDFKGNIWAWDGTGTITRYDGKTWTTPEKPLGLTVINGAPAPDGTFWVLGKDASGVPSLACWDGSQWIAGPALPGAAALSAFDDAGNLYITYGDTYVYQLPMVSAPSLKGNIAIQSSKTSVVADGNDQALVSIRVTGYDGAPVPDGTPITLRVIGPGAFNELSTVKYVDDSLPSGAVQVAEADSWTWVDTPVYSGLKAHKSDNVAGVHQHYFYAATPTNVSQGSVIEQWIYIPSGTVPREIMLQFRDTNGSWEHRAYWGENLIGWGADGTTARRYMGPIPAARDGWVKLTIKASDVGLDNLSINGVAYTLYQGSIVWDATTVVGPSKSITLHTTGGSATTQYLAGTVSGIATIVGYSDDANFMASTVSLDIAVK